MNPEELADLERLTQQQVELLQTNHPIERFDSNLNVRLSYSLMSDLQAHCRSKREDDGTYLTPSKLVRRLLIRHLYADQEPAKN